MKTLFLTIIFLLSFSSMVLSDEVQIPFSCWPKDLQREFARTGKKLDLDASKRTDKSWGYIINKGSNFVIYTYQSVTSEEFEIIQDIVFKIELSKRDIWQKQP